MSGGGLGQVCNAIPFDNKHDEIILFAGNNEINKIEDIGEFVYTVQKSVEKLQNLTNEVDTTLILPTTPITTPVEEAKAAYFEQNMRKVEKLKIVQLENIEYDESNHPTMDGTARIIEQIQESVNIILDGAKEHITTSKKYSNVQTMYKAGCRGCDSSDYTPDLCIDCTENAKLVDISELNDMLQAVYSKYFPVIGQNTDGNEGVNSMNQNTDGNEGVNSMNQNNDGNEGVNSMNQVQENLQQMRDPLKRAGSEEDGAASKVKKK